MSDCNDNRPSQEGGDDSNKEVVDSTNSVEAHTVTIIATNFNTNTTNNQEHISTSEEGNSSNMFTQPISTHTPSQKPQGLLLRTREERPFTPKKRAAVEGYMIQNSTNQNSEGDLPLPLPLSLPITTTNNEHESPNAQSKVEKAIEMAQLFSIGLKGTTKPESKARKSAKKLTVGNITNEIQKSKAKDGRKNHRRHP
jgi:hypothetical protein